MGTTVDLVIYLICIYFIYSLAPTYHV